MKSDRALVAHLMRRAGFGATPSELDKLTMEKTYEEIVEDLVTPERFPALDQSFIDRYYGGEQVAVHVGKWLYRMANTQRPLEEKMSLFLHHVFPVAWGKGEHNPSIYNEIDMFRRIGLTDIRTILLELSHDPAMIFWLDNNENHKDEINENYGRELLELFSLGVGNYTEDDIKAASRAFTGWTFRQPLSLYPSGNYPTEFEFLADDHDYGEKIFLGETGTFDGGDIIDIIARQPATARFISRHLYNFFVEDEAQVPAWNTEPPRNAAAIEKMASVFTETGGQMRPVLREMFNSDFFKQAADFKKVKSPTELVVGVVRQTGEFNSPTPGIYQFALTTLDDSEIESTMAVMGQKLLNPPTVGGVAHGPRVDRLRHPQRAHQVRGEPVRGRLQARREGDGGASGKPPRRSRASGKPLPRSAWRRQGEPPHLRFAGRIRQRAGQHEVRRIGGGSQSAPDDRVHRGLPVRIIGPYSTAWLGQWRATA